ncbi:hypothetical protein GCM10009092_24910 [Bowmanella denitrificans]|uniref:Uncharacterized protein n=1 Tax=Bowmanella denitrificans TaxID=366582 RepID=A0ABP3H0Y8_9ALTE
MDSPISGVLPNLSGNCWGELPMSGFNYFYAIDLAKLGFSIHGEVQHGKAIVA